MRQKGTMRLLMLFALLAALTAGAAAADDESPADGRNLNVSLGPPADGPADAFGKVDFRQPRDEHKIVYLDVRVRRLLPNRSYYLERAVDTAVDGVCTGTNWLRLGKGLDPEAITTNANGAGRAALFRDLAAVPTGTEFDIRFRVIDAATSGVVLQSHCYQYTVSQ
ncbi:MAG: hypothetical protein M3P42_07225 [Actinomycetota bacterium]|nr:hypothetical protein [Actinomycetota bacterium]